MHWKLYKKHIIPGKVAVEAAVAAAAIQKDEEGFDACLGLPKREPTFVLYRHSSMFTRNHWLLYCVRWLDWMTMSKPRLWIAWIC